MTEEKSQGGVAQAVGKLPEWHTPLPWAATTRKGSWDWVIYSTNDPNIEICQLFHDGTEDNETGEANADLIVRAVNALAAQPQAAPVEIDTLAGARKQAMKDHASMLPAAPVETEESNFDRAKTVPVAWIAFASNGNVRLWTSDEGRAKEEIEGGLDMQAFTLAELVGLISTLPHSPCSAETGGVAKMQATGRTKAGNDIGGI